MKEKILVVEDNPLNMKLVEMVLRTRDCNLFKAINGEEALEVAVREQPDLILMDISLPGISGLEVTRKLREMPSFRSTPIIGITAYAMKGDMEKVIDAGCDIYLSKPINTRKLPETIEEMLARRKKDSV
jgi:CheY-like chemotaxis protein